MTLHDDGMKPATKPEDDFRGAFASYREHGDF